MSSDIITLAVAAGVIAIVATVFGVCVYYASKELGKLTSDIVRAWTDD